MSQAPEAPKKRVRSAKSTTTSVATASKTEAKKSSTSKTSASKVTSSKAKSTSPRTRKSKGNSMTAVTPELRYRMIAEAAFFIAEAHGFDPNRSLNDWLEAETLIDARLGGGLTH